MKTGIVTILIALCLLVSVFAAMPRLPIDVDLLVLDGKEISSSLLRDTDSIELDSGPHQSMFRVGRAIHLSNSEKWPYISPPLAVSFNTQLINQISFHPPRLENEREANHSDAAPYLELLDGDATPIPVKLDIPVITLAVKATDYEVEVEHYNKSAKRASLPQFATMMTDDSTLLSGVSELGAIPPQSQMLTE